MLHLGPLHADYFSAVYLSHVDPSRTSFRESLRLEPHQGSFYIETRGYASGGQR